MEFFKESDCDIRERLAFDKAVREIDGITIDKANRLLKERGMVVYGPEPAVNGSAWLTNNSNNPNCTALLINVELIEKDSAEKFVRDWIQCEQTWCGDKYWVKRAKKLLGV